MNSFVIYVLLVISFFDIRLSDAPTFPPGEHDIYCVRDLSREPLADIGKCLEAVGITQKEYKNGHIFQHAIRDYFIWQSDDIRKKTAVIININPRNSFSKNTYKKK